jgi:hypothetical protein
MPFNIEPSDQVVIDWSDAGPNDALRITTRSTRASRPWVSYFCMIREDDGHRHLGLVPGAIPEPIRTMAYKAARELIGSCEKLSERELVVVEEWLAEQPGAEHGLLKVVADRLLDNAYVRGGNTVHDSLNIGMYFCVQFSDMDVLPRGVSGHIRTNKLWNSPAAIATITPVPRLAAIMHAAAHY